MYHISMKGQIIRLSNYTSNMKMGKRILLRIHNEFEKIDIS